MLVKEEWKEEVMVKEQGGGRGRSGRRLGEGMINVSFNDTFCACMFVMYHVPLLPSGII